MKLKSFLIENWVSCIAIIISILSIWLTISFRADQFAVVRYEKQLEAFKEILVMVNDSFTHVEPFLTIQNDFVEVRKIQRQYRTALEEMVQIQEKAIAIPNHLTEAQRVSFLYDIPNFNLDWSKVEIFKKKLHSTELIKIDNVNNLFDFVRLLENNPDENNGIVFVVLNNKENFDLSLHSGIFIKDKTGILESLFINSEEFNNNPENVEPHLARRLAFMKPQTEIWHEKFTEFKNLAKRHNSILARSSVFLEESNIRDIAVFWKKFDSIIAQNALILPQDVSESLYGYFSYCIKLPLLVTVPLLLEAGYDISNAQNIINIFQEANFDYYDKEHIAKFLSDLPQEWVEEDAARNRYFGELLKISHALSHYYPNSALDESLKRLVFGQASSLNFPTENILNRNK